MTELGHRLNEIELPDSEQAMRVAARIIGAEVAGDKARRKPWRRWFTSLFVGAAIGFAFTQPGRALTGELGRIVGIGEVGGAPVQSSQVAQFVPSSGEVVLAAGETVDAVPFGIVAYRTDKRIAGAPDETVCVNTEFVGGPRDRSGGCYAGALRYGAVCCTQIVIGDRVTSIPYAEGQVNPRVARVTVSYVDVLGATTTLDATVGMITPALADRLEITHPSGLFFVSLPGLATLDRPGPLPLIPSEPVEVATFDADGNALESETAGPRR